MSDPQSKPPAGAPLLAVRDLRKTYRIGRREVEVLRGVSFDVSAGDFVALRGASGSGKSTLLHLLGGLDLPDAGSIAFEGDRMESWDSQQLSAFRNRRIGFIFQAYHLLPELDALENVCLPARIARNPATAVVRRAQALLKRVGLSERMDHRPAELSGGEQQRVAIARALINDPPLVLADEPTGNLDSRTGGGIMDLLDSLQREEGVTLMMVTHDPVVAARAPRVLELVDGRIA